MHLLEKGARGPAQVKPLRPWRGTPLLVILFVFNVALAFVWWGRHEILGTLVASAAGFACIVAVVERWLLLRHFR